MGHKADAISDPSIGPPRQIRTFKVWMPIDAIMRIDHEILRRKAAGEDVDKNDVRFNVNRSTILRDLVDQHLPKLPLT